MCRDKCKTLVLSWSSCSSYPGSEPSWAPVHEKAVLVLLLPKCVSSHKKLHEKFEFIATASMILRGPWGPQWLLLWISAQRSFTSAPRSDWIPRLHTFIPPHIFPSELLAQWKSVCEIIYYGSARLLEAPWGCRQCFFFCSLLFSQSLA